MKIAYGAIVSRTFIDRVVALCARLLIPDPNRLMAAMAFESGRSFDPAKRNPQSGATGLIQFMPSTARGLGTTTDELAMMSAEDQLHYVERYLEPFKGRLNTLPDLYMAILWPAAVGKPDDAALFAATDSNSRAYAQNKGLDVDHDGVITKREAAAYVERALQEGLSLTYAAEIEPGEAIAPAPAQPHTPAAPSATAAQPGATMPLVPLLLSLLPSVLGLFAPKAQQKLQQVTGQPTEVVAPFLTDLFTKIAQATGVLAPGQPIATEAQAIQAAGAVQSASSEQLQAIQQHALDYLDRVAPMLDKISTYEQAAWDAEEASRNAAASRSLAQQEAGVWNNPTFIIALIVLTLVAVVVVAVLFVGSFSSDMQAFVIGAIVGSALTAVLSFYFGSSRNSAAKDATISTLANKS